MFALNILIVRQLVKRATKRQEMTGQDGQDPNRRLTILLVFISTWSFLVSTPKMIAYMIHIWYYRGLLLDPELDQRLHETTVIGDSVRLLNFSCNFFFYCLSGSQFRDDLIRALYRIFCCRCEYKQTRTSSFLCWLLCMECTENWRIMGMCGHSRQRLGQPQTLQQVGSYNKLNEALTIPVLRTLTLSHFPLNIGIDFIINILNNCTLNNNLSKCDHATLCCVIDYLSLLAYSPSIPSSPRRSS